VAIIGGEPYRFRPLVDLYREAGRRAGYGEEVLKVGVHALGYVADTDEQAANDFFPGYAREFTQIGRERGWPPVTRRQFESVRGPTGALIVSDPKGVVEKIAHYNESIGGISRLTFQMSVAGLSHEKLVRSIELIGKEVIPRVKEQIQAA
jgi:alkanesulfonate monooxygenase SsuD/methylene tetrahydromethanopterin reductase-like flavin-dependent oxidoreductase (luciferase family)